MIEIFYWNDIEMKYNYANKGINSIIICNMCIIQSELLKLN